MAWESPRANWKLRLRDVLIFISIALAVVVACLIFPALWIELALPLAVFGAVSVVANRIDWKKFRATGFGTFLLNPLGAGLFCSVVFAGFASGFLALMPEGVTTWPMHLIAGVTIGSIAVLAIRDWFRSRK